MGFEVCLPQRPEGACSANEQCQSGYCETNRECAPSGGARIDGGPLCAPGAADGGAGSCNAGTQCTNSICEPTCAADGSGCPAGLYCESTTPPLNICSPIQTTACATDLDCPYGQTCAPGGICSSLEARANGTTSGCFSGMAVDGCAPDSLCYPIPQNGLYYYYCVGLSHCSEDGGCPNLPTGVGSVCNELPDGGYLYPGKERLCLYGFCVDSSNCSTSTFCFHRTQGDPLGQCQQGFPGDPCYTYMDCGNSPTGCDVTLDGGVDAGEDDGGTLGNCY